MWRVTILLYRKFPMIVIPTVVALAALLFTNSHAMEATHPSQDGKEVHKPFIRILPPRYQNEVVVLMYHDVGEMTALRGIISPSLFAAQMHYLKEMGYHVISHAELQAFLDGKGTVPPNAIAITFDDGYQSFYEYAYPILKQHNFPATNFVIVGETEREGLTPVPQHLTWAEIREMSSSGLIDFESHTYDSHYYMQVDAIGHKKPALMGRRFDLLTEKVETETEYEERIRKDLALAKRVLEENLKASILSFAFPYGAYNSTVVRVAQELGYRYFFTIESGVNGHRSNAHIEGHESQVVLVKRISAGDSYMTVDRLNRMIHKTVNSLNWAQSLPVW